MLKRLTQLKPGAKLGVNTLLVDGELVGYKGWWRRCSAPTGQACSNRTLDLRRRGAASRMVELVAWRRWHSPPSRLVLVFRWSSVPTGMQDIASVESQ